MPLVGDPIDPADYSGALATLATRCTTLETLMTGVLAALVDRIKAANVIVNGRDGSINGSTTNIITQCGTQTGTTDGSGQITCNYPQSFPHGALIAIPVNGDTTAAQFVPGVEIINATGIVVKCDDFAGAALASTAVRIDWIAYGW